MLRRSRAVVELARTSGSAATSRSTRAICRAVAALARIAFTRREMEVLQYLHANPSRAGGARRTAGAGLGLRKARRNRDAHRRHPHRKTAPQDRGESKGPGASDHRARRRLPVDQRWLIGLRAVPKSGACGSCSALFFAALVVPTGVLVYHAFGRLTTEAFYQHRVLGRRTRESHRRARARSGSRPKRRGRSPTIDSWSWKARRARTFCSVRRCRAFRWMHRFRAWCRTSRSMPTARSVRRCCRRASTRRRTAWPPTRSAQRRALERQGACVADVAAVDASTRGATRRDKSAWDAKKNAREGRRRSGGVRSSERAESCPTGRRATRAANQLGRVEDLKLDSKFEARARELDRPAPARRSRKRPPKSRAWRGKSRPPLPIIQAAAAPSNAAVRNSAREDVRRRTRPVRVQPARRRTLRAVPPRLARRPTADPGRGDRAEGADRAASIDAPFLETALSQIERSDHRVRGELIGAAGVSNATGYSGGANATASCCIARRCRRRSTTSS